MPDAALPVNRFRQSSSRSSHNAAVLTSSEVAFDTSTVVSLRSSSCPTPDPVKPGLFLPRSRPWHLTTAAEGGLKPAPVSRFRGARPHRLNSYARSALASFACSWRTITRLLFPSRSREELSTIRSERRVCHRIRTRFVTLISRNRRSCLKVALHLSVLLPYPATLVE
jgi:hypothetical protein